MAEDYRFKNETIFVFANTGLEDERTLIFVNECDRRWALGVIWVEAKFGAYRKGTTFTRVTFETASRNGEPFEKMIEKYGIPNKAFPHCTRELKERTIKAYARSIGWKAGEYLTAIGIRADEPKRIKKNFYPLFSVWPITKPEILEWWTEQPFDLGMKDHEGNCITCWKKSDSKLVRIMLEQPQSFGFMERMESAHAFTGAGCTGDPRRFFRGFKSVADIKGIAALTDLSKFRDYPEEDSGCSESCEPFQS
jgi:hypothetical protein